LKKIHVMAPPSGQAAGITFWIALQKVKAAA
jgi:hypothetical protein